MIAALLLLAHAARAQLDPSEFFRGSQRRPKLEIVYPDNGQVLDDTDLDIRIRVTGYDVPSVFHDSSICVALSATGVHTYSEHCFDQTPDLVFHAKGLSPGAGYSLRIVFYERGKAIAMSVRSFRVAGIRGVTGQDDDTVTIQTALQIAVQHQTVGMHVEAERIYRNILRENPAHPYALHLLGIIFYQKGQPSLAIPYIEQALSSFKEGLNTSAMAARDLDNFHNTLGECYRVLGRVEEAEREFRVALSINPRHYSAEFNLGLTYQQMNRWDDAIARYGAAQELAALYPARVDRKTLLECKIRQCDLLQAKDGGLQGWHALQAARRCWDSGLHQFPRNGIMHNELGNVLVQLGEAEKALDSYRTAQDLGNDLAELNIATVLEILGYADEARALFSEAAASMGAKGLSVHHVMLKRALLLPRIMPAAPAELSVVRSSLEAELDRLLALPAKELAPSTASPLSFGFSLGYFLAFHGQNNVAIKTKLHRLFSRFCPALPTGRFIDEVVSLRGLTPVDSEAALVAAGMRSEVVVALPDSEVLNVAVAPTGGSDRDGFDDASGATVVDASVDGADDGVIRVGFASRYLSDGHSVGALAIRVIELLSRYNRDASDSSRPKFHVSVYMVAVGRNEDDAMQGRVIEAADKIVFLPTDLNTCNSVIRRAKLHVLIYPEIGIDPVTYFLAFGQLAKTQVAWFGHPESSGLPSVQWFVSIDAETPDSASRYSEGVHLMRGMSSCFTDEYTHLAQELHASPRNVLLHRARFLELLEVPRAAHIYLVAEPLYKLHGQFDEAIASILLQDKLAYLLILDSANRRSWQQLYVDRMAGRFSGSVRERIVFYVTSDQGPNGENEERENVIRAMAAAHVMLDPFPAAGFREPLRALGLGLPVITMPSQQLSGRFTLAMYSQMHYRDLIVSSTADYVSLALSLAHKPKFRQHVVGEILSRVSVLFDCANVERDWVAFLTEVHAKNGPASE